MTPANRAVLDAMCSAANASIVLDFGTRPGLGYRRLHELRAAGVAADWDGATLTIPLADANAAGIFKAPES